MAFLLTVSTKGPAIGRSKTAGKAYDIHKNETAMVEPVDSKILVTRMKLTRLIVSWDRICEVQSGRKCEFLITGVNDLNISVKDCGYRFGLLFQVEFSSNNLAASNNSFSEN